MRCYLLLMNKSSLRIPNVPSCARQRGTGYLESGVEVGDEEMGNRGQCDRINDEKVVFFVRRWNPGNENDNYNGS